MWANICRICSSRADYDIFSKIPAYLHATSNEFINWQTTINILIENTTGLMINPEDGLPTKICALCISYLKHAVTFRQQAINNTLSLKAITLLSAGSRKQCEETSSSDRNTEIITDQSTVTDNDKEKVLVTADDLLFNENRKTETNNLVNTFNNQNNRMRCKSLEYATKNLLLLDEKNENISSNGKNVQCDLINNRLNIQQEKESTGSKNAADQKALTKYLNLLFDKSKNASISPDYDAIGKRSQLTQPSATKFVEENNPFGEDSQSASSEDVEICEQQPKENFFSYKEKNFEEDDIMELDVLKDANITINIPEICKERKCRACFRRFMFEESYNEHIDTCIEHKFLTLIEELNRLLAIRRSKAVSPHEFIRRMIFCLRKTSEWLNSTCGEMLLPDLLFNNRTRQQFEGDGKAANDSSNSGGSCVGKQLDRNLIFETISNHSDEIDDRKILNDPLFDLLQSDADDFPLQLHVPSKKAIIDDKDNILTLIENSQHNDQMTKINSIDNNEPSIDFIKEENFNFIHKLRNATKENSPSALKVECVQESIDVVSSNNPPPHPPPPVFSARCNTCSILFESVASLEEHNANLHNASSRWEQHQKIIALFEDEDEDDPVNVI